eukprot:3057225-Ditylum_brightwellii.AAC.1
MREETRRSYVKSVYGKDKAKLMLQKLEHGLSMQKWQYDGAALEECFVFAHVSSLRCIADRFERLCAWNGDTL